MLILLEGVDRTGKSTLAEALGDSLNAPVLHKSAPTQVDAFTEYLAPLAGYEPNRGLNLICDRWHWGEMVWPEIYGRPSILGPSSFFYIEDALSNLGALMVHCTGDLTEVWSRIVQTRDEPLYSKGVQVFTNARERFEQIARKSEVPSVRYDFAAPGNRLRTLGDWVDRVEQHASFVEGNA